MIHTFRSYPNNPVRQIAMNFTNPSREQFKAIYGLSADQPAHMLNLLRFREHAQYGPADIEVAEARLSGRDAYQRYSEEAGKIFRGVGGTQLWIGQAQATLIGPTDEPWSLVFVACYPTVQAFIDMVKNEAYQRATRHRTAAVADSRLIVCSPLQASSSFAPSTYLTSS